MPTSRYLQLLCVISLFVITGCAKPAPVTPKIAAFEQNAAPQQLNKIRFVALKEAARGVGAQAGLAYRSRQINHMLEIQKLFLEEAFNFRGLMLSHNVLPPVLEEGINTLNLDGSSALRLADRTYQITAPAKFVTTVPTWRDYLWQNYSNPEAPDSSLLPKSDVEREVWNHYVTLGWQEGLIQAHEIFEVNLNKLRRDILGMVLYRKLLAQHIVTPPYISKAELGVTGNEQNVRVNDRVLRIAAVAKLKPDSSVWQSRLSTNKIIPKKAISKKKPAVRKAPSKARKPTCRTK